MVLDEFLNIVLFSIANECFSLIIYPVSFQIAANAPKGILRTPQTISKFQQVAVI